MLSLSKHNSDHPAVIHGGTTWTYGELNRRSVRIARNLLSAGLETGDRIVTLLPNCPELVALYIAGFRAGFTIVPLDIRYHSALINYALRHSGARAVVVDGVGPPARPPRRPGRTPTATTATGRSDGVIDRSRTSRAGGTRAGRRVPPHPRGRGGKRKPIREGRFPAPEAPPPPAVGPKTAAGRTAPRSCGERRAPSSARSPPRAPPRVASARPSGRSPR